MILLLSKSCRSWLRKSLWKARISFIIEYEMKELDGITSE
jgi:hypothetical protein